MPRVLRILNRLVIGGPSKNAVYLTKYMQPDFETLLVIGGKENHEQDDESLASSHQVEPVCISEMKRSLSVISDWSAFSSLKKIIKDFKPDIVHTHAAKSGALGRLAARQCKVPVIIHTFHGHVLHSYFNSIKSNLFIRTERYLAGLSDAIIAISEVQKKELAEKFNIAPPEKFRVIPLGLDLENFISDQEPKRKKFRTEFGLDENEIAIGIIGRLVPIKNHRLFIKSISALLNSGNQHFKAFIIGDGETKEQLEQVASSMGINFTKHTDSKHPHPLVFTSWRTDIDIMLAGLDIVALTSQNEGTPVSLIEAQAAGKPIVSTRVGGITDVVLENKTALLSDINDEDKFIENLIKLVTSQELRSSFQNAGKDHVLLKFGYKRLVDDMSRLYFELLEKKSSSKK